MGKLKDFSQFDKGQIVMTRQLGKSICHYLSKMV